MKRVRILLRVSSNQQLEADGDLTVQRRLIKEYIEKQPDWLLDEKEYFEGANSGYKNSVDNRTVLQEALRDAKKKEYDILCAYKDDRIGRRMWEIGAYIMNLKDFGVDIYTVRDGCISPSYDDIMGQMMLALRYGNAQKSSSDTGMRVKDTAQKLVQKGKFMGGTAPYGYELALSGEISKHGRALKKLVIVPEQAEVVKKIFDLSLSCEYGSSRITRFLNTEEPYKSKAPRDIWKAGTITSILTNPIYAGYTAYKRREKTNGRYHRLDSKDWIYAEKANPEIQIIDEQIWNEVQRKRQQRAKRILKPDILDVKNTIRENKGELTLIDVLYCKTCKSKLTNGTKYNYWTLKDGEKRTSKYGIYQCSLQRGGVPHAHTNQYDAKELEQAVYKQIGDYLESIQNKTEIFTRIVKNSQMEKERISREIQNLKKEIQKSEEGIRSMERILPEVLTGKSQLSLETLQNSISIHKETKSAKEAGLQKLLQDFENTNALLHNRDEICRQIPGWREVFFNADKKVKRVLIDRIIDQITADGKNIHIKFKISVPESCRTDIDSVVQK